MRYEVSYLNTSVFVVHKNENRSTNTCHLIKHVVKRK